MRRMLKGSQNTMMLIIEIKSIYVVGAAWGRIFNLLGNSGACGMPYSPLFDNSEDTRSTLRSPLHSFTG